MGRIAYLAVGLLSLAGCLSFDAAIVASPYQQAVRKELAELVKAYGSVLKSVRTIRSKRRKVAACIGRRFTIWHRHTTVVQLVRCWIASF